jgi:hypothetical protein
MRKFLNFYGRLFAKALSHSWGVFDIISTVLGVILPILAKLHPEWGSAMSDLAWQIPLTALATLFLTRLFLAPYWLYSEQETDAARAEAALREKIEGLTSEMTRPKFRIRNPRVDESNDGDKYQFDYDLENVGSRSASNIVVRVVLVKESLDEEPKIIESSLASEVAINEPLNMSLSMGTPSLNEPAHYIVVAMRYADAVTKKPYKQIFFVKWQGVKRGDIAQDIIHLTQEERQKLEEHLKELLTDFV